MLNKKISEAILSNGLKVMKERISGLEHKVEEKKAQPKTMLNQKKA